MASHNELGKKGEILAASWLLQHGYTVMHQNWRHAHCEVDFIAHRDEVLHIIEVKSRSNDNFGYPEESVDDKKIENLMIAAEAYLFQYPEWKRIQYDVLSILLKPGDVPDYLLIEDVYVSGI